MWPFMNVLKEQQEIRSDGNAWREDASSVNQLAAVHFDLIYWVHDYQYGGKTIFE